MIRTEGSRICIQDLAGLEDIVRGDKAGAIPAAGEAVCYRIRADPFKTLIAKRGTFSITEMKGGKILEKIKMVPLFTVFFALLAFSLCLPVVTYAHCDTLDGPVVAAARAALAAGDVTPLLKWVSIDEEENIRAAFKHTLAVRKLGDEAKQFGHF